MFAHVVTAQAEADAFEDLTRFIREQLPAIPQQPGCRGDEPETSKRSSTAGSWHQQSRGKPRVALFPTSADPPIFSSKPNGKAPPGAWTQGGGATAFSRSRSA